MGLNCPSYHQAPAAQRHFTAQISSTFPKNQLKGPPMAEAKDNGKEIQKKMDELKKLMDQQERLTKDIEKLAKDKDEIAQQMKALGNTMKAQQKAAMAVIKNLKA